MLSSGMLPGPFFKVSPHVRPQMDRVYCSKDEEEEEETRLEGTQGDLEERV